MKTLKIVVENKFFLKIFMTYCIIIIMGLSFTSYFITSRMISVLVDTESKFENEILQKVRDKSEENTRMIDNIFKRLYYRLNNNFSIVDLINPDMATKISDRDRMDIISNFLRNIHSDNNFITDIFLLDYSRQDVFFSSNIRNRDISVNYDFFKSDLFNNGEIDTSKRLLHNYVPKYINASVERNFPVITYYINLFDYNSRQFDKSLGIVAINIRPEQFGEAYKESKSFKGKILVLDKNGFVFFDSSNTLTGKQFPFADYKADGISDLFSKNGFIVNKHESKVSGFTYVDIVDRQVIVAEVENIRKEVNNIIFICLATVLIISAFASHKFAFRIKSLVKYMRKVEVGKFDEKIPVKSDDEIGYLEKSFNTMCKNLDEHIRNVYVYEMKIKKAELGALQAQINPHFLFNTLESIRIIAQTNKDVRAAKMIHMLGKMYRWNINMKGMIVELREEIEYINSYIDLQKIRYENIFNVSMDIDDGILDLGVPKLILQPIIENAIYHGLNGKSEGGEINIKGFLEGETYIIEIADNGKGIEKERIDEVKNGMYTDMDTGDLYKIGLSNVHQRINILFGDPYGVGISSGPNSGTTVRLTIPALTKERMKGFVQSDNS